MPNFCYIDMPAEDIHSVHTTNFRKSPTVGSLIPRKPSGNPGGPKSSTSTLMRYKGPIFLPSHIYKMLSEPAIKALNSYSAQATDKCKALDLPTYMPSHLQTTSNPPPLKLRIHLLKELPPVNQTWIIQHYVNHSP